MGVHGDGHTCNWLTHCSSQQCKYRIALIWCIASGFIQKSRILFAADVRTLTDVLQSCHQHGLSGSALGQVALFCRQIFATTGQLLVLQYARCLKGRHMSEAWPVALVKALLQDLRQLPGKFVSKRKGFMSIWSGPRWLHLAFRSSLTRSQVSKASSVLGQYIEGRVGFLEACRKLKGHCRIPGLGTYSVPHVVRACTPFRMQLGHGDGLCSGSWQHLRGMHADSTRHTFDLLGVVTYKDALSMRLSVLEMMCGHFASRHSSSCYRQMSVVDLPCQVCEFKSLLKVVCSVRQLRFSAAATWLLKRLSVVTEHCVCQAKSLKLKTLKNVESRSGLDEGSSACVVRVWLHGSTPCLSRSAWHVYLCLRSRVHGYGSQRDRWLGNVAVVMAAPVLRCCVCGREFNEVELQPRVSGGRKRTACSLH